MDITPFIRELLFSHDCVIIPGFGGFIGNYSPSSIDKVTSTFYPPVKKILFNRNLSNNDGLLAGKISECLGISFSDAVRIIEEFVLAVRQRIESGEKVVFDKIGSFNTNHEGSIQFEPDRNVNYHPGSFGLESFQFPPAGDYDVRKRITRHIDRDTEHVHSTRKIIRRAAVILPVVALAAIVPIKTNLFKPRLQTTTLNPVITAESESNKKVEPGSTLPLPVTPEEVKPSSSDEAAQNISDVTEIKSAIQAEEGHFCLITGSFMLKENADQQVNILKKAGFNPEIIAASNGFFRVSAMRCSDLSTAIEKKDSLIKIYPGTWVRKI